MFYPLEEFAARRWSGLGLSRKILSRSLVASLLLLLAPQLNQASLKSAYIAEMKTDAPGEVIESGAVLSQRPEAKATFVGKYRATTPDGQGVVTYLESGGRFSKNKTSVTHLYSLEGVKLASFEGEFQRFTLDRQGLFTYLDGQTYLYSLDGIRQAVFQGAPVSYTPDRQGILVSDDFGGTVRMIGGVSPTRLYDLSGVERAVFPGNFAAFTPDGERLIATCLCQSSGLVSRIYSLDGVEQTTLEGRFVGFSPDEQKIIAVDADRTRLYSLDGELQQSMQGQFAQAAASGIRIGLADIDRTSSFMPNGQGLITSDNENSWLYDLEGNLQQTLRGRFWNFTPDGESIITYTFGGQSWLYDQDGTLKQTFNEHLLSFTPDGQGAVTQSRNQSYLYDSAGNLQSRLRGSFVAFMPDGEGIVTNGSDASGYHSLLYDLDGDAPARLEGMLLGFVLDNQRLVTSSGGVYGPYYIYRPDGTLQVVSRTWPQATPDGKGFVVTVEGQSQIYQLNGGAIAIFDGIFQAFTQNGTGLMTYSEAEERSQLYPLDSPIQTN